MVQQRLSQPDKEVILLPTPWKSGVSPPGLAEQESYQLTHTAGHIANHPKTLLLCTAFRGPQTLQMLDG